MKQLRQCNGLPKHIERCDEIATLHKATSGQLSSKWLEERKRKLMKTQFGLKMTAGTVYVLSIMCNNTAVLILCCSAVQVIQRY